MVIAIVALFNSVLTLGQSNHNFIGYNSLIKTRCPSDPLLQAVIILGL